MNSAAFIAVALVAGLHFYILALEMFYWNTPRAQRAFGLTPEFAKATRVLAANQGLYNGFLGAGLLWGLVRGSADISVRVFFLVCVIVAGAFGGMTAQRKIWFVQALPGAVALALVVAAHMLAD